MFLVAGKSKKRAMIANVPIQIGVPKMNLFVCFVSAAIVFPFDK